MSARFSLSRRSYSSVLIAAFLAFGCDDPLKEESLIQETRVLGARLEVSNDPDRASPGPGESVHFEAFTAAPDGAPNVSFAFSVCGVQPTNSGFPNCATPSFGSAVQAEPMLGNPSFDFTVPAELDTHVTPHGFVSGVVCSNDTTALDDRGNANCANGGGDAVAFEFDFAGPGEDNKNPNFTANSLTLDGAAWPAPGAMTTCDALPQIALGSKHTFGVTLTADDFDSLVQTTSEDPTSETILLSQFSTAGKLAHVFSSLTPTTPGLASNTEWDAPAKPDPNGPITHFYFVIRDSRGGEDLAVRALCVSP